MEAVGQLTGGIAHDFNNMLAVVVGGIDLARRRLNGPRREVDDPPRQCDGGRDPRRRPDPPPAGLRPLRAAAARAGRQRRAGRRHARAARPHARRADQGRHRSRRRRLAGLRRPAPARKRDPQPGRQRPRRDGRRRRADHRDVATSRSPANEVGDIRAGEYVRDQRHRHRLRHDPRGLERAFEPFFTTKAVGKGTGLGLSQIFGFAHQSGGEVGIESELGKGTTVSIYLPRTDAPRRPMSGCIPPRQRRRPTSPSPAPRILLVEDDPRVRPRRSARSRNWATSRSPAPAAPRRSPCSTREEFDLVISDVIMPEMTGPELIRRAEGAAAPTSPCCSSPAMSAKARATIWSATNCCASRSRSARWPARSRPRSRAGLADRARSEEPRQQADRRQQRLAPLPGLQLDLGPGVAVDLPGDIFGAAGIGGAGLGQPEHRQRLAFDAGAAPSRAGGAAARSPRQRRRGEAPIALGIGVDDRAGASLALGAQLGRIGQREGPPPPVERLVACLASAGAPPSRVGAARATAAIACCSRAPRRPPRPAATAGRSAPRPRRCASRAR